MNIQLKSDLHWEEDVHSTRVIPSSPEMDDNYVSPKADVLVLAGDMINAKEAHIDYLLHRFKDITIPILYVPGNHEYWDCNFIDAKDLLKKKLKDTNITLLDRDDAFIVDEQGDQAIFVGATLWTNLIRPDKAFIAGRTKDFERIKGMTTNSWSNRHVHELAHIERILDYRDYKDYKKVVITHYLPSSKSVPPQHKGNDLNCIFVADDAEGIIVQHQPELWLHGHTHDSNDYLIGKTRVVSNPKGRWYSYFNGLNAKYNNELILTI